MNTGSGWFENSVPHGGFKIDRRKDALVPMWADDDLNPVRPFEDSPCLHRVVANMQTDADSILTMANKFGLLIAAPEPLDLWRQRFARFAI